MQQKPTPSGIFKIGFGFWEAKALLSAVELGVFTELAKGPAGLEALSCNLGLHERSARDFLDALVALQLLERQNGLYSNTDETDLFLDKAKLCWRAFRDGEREALRVLELFDRSAHNGPESERGQGYRRSLCRPLCRSRQAAQLPCRHERCQPRRRAGDRHQISVEKLQVICRYRNGPRHGARDAHQSPSASFRRRI